MKTTKSLYLFMGMAAGLIVGYLTFHQVDPNAQREYGSSGLPKNCRALIYENESDYHLGHKYSQEELLLSIFRNCGETGFLWSQ